MGTNKGKLAKKKYIVIEFQLMHKQLFGKAEHGCTDGGGGGGGV